MTTTDVPPAVAAIVVEGLTKRYGRVMAVDDVSFTVRPGAVTGFLGPNGAGKTTALKVIVGLARPTAGGAILGGTPVHAGAPDARMLGVHIEPCGAHPGRSARNHLRSLAALAGLPRGRVDEVLAVVGLEQAAGRRVGSYSMGMRQRLGLASALLGDPEILVLDERERHRARRLRVRPRRQCAEREHQGQVAKGSIMTAPPGGITTPTWCICSCTPRCVDWGRRRPRPDGRCHPSPPRSSSPVTLGASVPAGSEDEWSSSLNRHGP